MQNHSEQNEPQIVTEKYHCFLCSYTINYVNNCCVKPMCPNCKTDKYLVNIQTFLNGLLMEKVFNA